MKAVIITAVLIVLILAIGIPVIHYATKSDKATVSAKTLATGKAVKDMVPQVPPAQQPVQQMQQESAEDELSAKEVLEQYKQGESVQTETGSKTGYTVAYLINQSKQQQQATCQPLLDSAQKKVDDASLAAEAKEKAYDDARDELREMIDEDADESDIEDARDDVEAAKKAYEAALAAKYAAQDELVNARVQCASYLT